VEHAEHLPRAFPWRAATVVVGAIAALELVVLIGIGATHIASSLRTHKTAAPAHPARVTQPVRRHVVKVAASPPHALRARTRLSVLVLNGNGVSGAAGREAVSLQTLGYGSTRSQDAPRHDYARSMVLYRPGYVQEARRLAHDARVALVAPVDGMTKAQLKGSPLVVVLGGN
jgi:hypothetical protein